MTSVGDVIALIEVTAKIVEASQAIRYAEKEIEELRDRIQILADTLRKFIDVSVSLTGKNKRNFDKINCQIESRMTFVQNGLEKEEKAWRRTLGRVLWPAKKDAIKEHIEAMERLDDQVRKVFQTQNAESTYTVSGILAYQSPCCGLRTLSATTQYVLSWFKNDFNDILAMFSIDPSR